MAEYATNLRAFPSAALYRAAPHPHEMPEVVR
jgi:hypothetical protein